MCVWMCNLFFFFCSCIFWWVFRIFTWMCHLYSQNYFNRTGDTICMLENIFCDFRVCWCFYFQKKKKPLYFQEILSAKLCINILFLTKWRIFFFFDECTIRLSILLSWAFEILLYDILLNAAKNLFSRELSEFLSKIMKWHQNNPR